MTFSSETEVSLCDEDESNMPPIPTVTFNFVPISKLQEHAPNSTIGLSFASICTTDRFCRTMLCKRGLWHHAVSVCLSVCLRVCVCHVHTSVKTNKHIFEIFSPSGSQVILVFPYQTVWQYSERNPPNGASNAGGVCRNRDMSVYLA